MTDCLIKRLRECVGDYSFSLLIGKAADALEAQAKRIAELESEVSRWKDNFAKVQERERQEWGRAEKAEAHLGNLLAMLHRDGGHYQGEHGTDNAVGEATMVWSELILRAEKAEARIAELEGGAAVALSMELDAKCRRLEADLAAARTCITAMVGKFGKEAEQEYPEHAPAIAAARGEQPSPVKSCGTCGHLTESGCPTAEGECDSSIGYPQWQPKSDVCQTCGGNCGSWQTDTTDDGWHDCPDCGGTGEQPAENIKMPDDTRGLLDRVQAVRAALDGEQPDPEKSCESCGRDAASDPQCLWADEGICIEPDRRKWQPKSDECPTCDGFGSLDSEHRVAMYKCPDCEGTGKKEKDND